MTSPLLSKGLQTSLRLALTEARRMRHTHLTLEHVLLAMLKDKRTGEVLDACGARTDRLQQKLEKYLAENVEKQPDGSNAELRQTSSVERVLHRAAIRALHAEQEVIDGGDVLVAMWRESDSYAARCLEEEEVQQKDILDFVSRGLHKEGAGEDAVLAYIAALPSTDRAMGERLHALILRSAPRLQATIRWGSPWYAKDGRMVCFFRPGRSYMTFGLAEEANLTREEGATHQLLESAWYFSALDEATEAKLSAIVQKAAG